MMHHLSFLHLAVTGHIFLASISLRETSEKLNCSYKAFNNNKKAKLHLKGQYTNFSPGWCGSVD